MAFEETGVRAVLEGVSAYERDAARVNAATQRIVTEAAQAARQAQSQAAQLGALGAQMRQTGQQAVLLGAALAGPGLAAVHFAVQFESAFAGVRKTVDATEAEFATLRTGLLNLTRDIPTSAGGLAGIAEAAGQLGVAKQDILDFTTVTAQLAATTNLTTDEAANSLARFANILQIPQTELRNVASALVDLGNKGAATESEILEISLRLAGAGKVIGLSADQVLSFGNALASLGINAEAGGSAFSRVFVEIAKAVQSGGKDLEGFAEVAGQTSAEFATAFEKDAAAAVITFVEGLGRITDEGGHTFQVLEDLSLGDIRLRDALLRASGAGDLLRTSLQNGATAFRENSALTTEFEKRLNTTSAQFQLLLNDIQRVAISAGTVLLPTLRGLIGAAREVGEVFEALPAGLQGAVAGFSLLAGGAIVTVGALGIVAGSLLNISAVFPLLTAGAGASSAALAAEAAGAAAAAAGNTALTGAMTRASLAAAALARSVGAVPGPMALQAEAAAAAAVGMNAQASASARLTATNLALARSAGTAATAQTFLATATGGATAATAAFLTSPVVLGLTAITVAAIGAAVIYSKLTAQSEEVREAHQRLNKANAELGKAVAETSRQYVEYRKAVDAAVAGKNIGDANTVAGIDAEARAVANLTEEILKHNKARGQGITELETGAPAPTPGATPRRGVFGVLEPGEENAPTPQGTALLEQVKSTQASAAGRGFRRTDVDEAARANFDFAKSLLGIEDPLARIDPLVLKMVADLSASERILLLNASAADEAKRRFLDLSNAASSGTFSPEGADRGAGAPERSGVEIANLQKQARLELANAERQLEIARRGGAAEAEKLEKADLGSARATAVAAQANLDRLRSLAAEQAKEAPPVVQEITIEREAVPPLEPPPAVQEIAVERDAPPPLETPPLTQEISVERTEPPPLEAPSLTQKVVVEREEPPPLDLAPLVQEVVVEREELPTLDLPAGTQEVAVEREEPPPLELPAVVQDVAVEREELPPLEPPTVTQDVVVEREEPAPLEMPAVSQTVNVERVELPALTPPSVEQEVIPRIADFTAPDLPPVEQEIVPRLGEIPTPEVPPVTVEVEFATVSSDDLKAAERELETALKGVSDAQRASADGAGALEAAESRVAQAKAAVAAAAYAELAAENAVKAAAGELDTLRKSGTATAEQLAGATEKLGKASDNYNAIQTAGLEPQRAFSEASREVQAALRNQERVQDDAASTADDLQRAQDRVTAALRETDRISGTLPGRVGAITNAQEALAASADKATIAQLALNRALFATELARSRAIPEVFTQGADQDAEAAGVGAPEDFKKFGNAGLTPSERLELIKTEGAEAVARVEAELDRQRKASAEATSAASKAEREFRESLAGRTAEARKQLEEQRAQARGEAILREALGGKGPTLGEVQEQQARVDAAFDKVRSALEATGNEIPESLIALFDNMTAIAKSKAEEALEGLQQSRARSLGEALGRQEFGLEGFNVSEIEAIQNRADTVFARVRDRLVELGVEVPEGMIEVFDRMAETAEEQGKRKGEQIGGILGFLLARRLGQGLDPGGGLINVPSQSGALSGGSVPQPIVNFNGPITYGAGVTTGDIQQGTGVAYRTALSQT